jgi:hypothetical protein
MVLKIMKRRHTRSQFQLLALKRTKPVVRTELVHIYKTEQLLTQDYPQK